jgi:nitroreductase
LHVDDAITSRRSIRRFLPTPVDRAMVEHLLEVSARAPSGHNVQPWRVHALAGEPLARLCADILSAAREDAQHHLPEYEYYPTEWHEPYLGRRRATGFGLYEALGIALGHVDPDAPENAFVTTREPVSSFTTFHGFAPSRG